MSATTAIQQLRETIAAYNDAWNSHDVERIGSIHAPDMVFENHTAGHGRDPVRAREGQAQGCLLRLGLDPAPGRAALAPL
jgi:ketosteroid isomerase-like protein